MNQRNERSRRFGLITGAASGLGRALSHRLAQAGYELAVTDIDSDRLQQVATEIGQWSPTSFAHALDVRDPSAWSATRAALAARWGRLDLLVNSAGTLAIGDFSAVPPDQAKRVIDVNLLGVIHGCQTCGNLLMASGQRARIINVASCAGFLTFPWSATYNAAKAGVLAYSETLANELADSAVSVTVACPGFFSSPLVDAADYSDPVLERCARRVFERSALTIDGVAKEISVWRGPGTIACDGALSGSRHVVVQAVLSRTTDAIGTTHRAPHAKPLRQRICLALRQRAADRHHFSLQLRRTF